MSPLYKDFELEHISQQQIGENTMMRISRLIAVKWLAGEKDLNLLEQLPPADQAGERERFLVRHLP